MAKLYKLTDENGWTRRGFENETKWEVGKWNTVAEGGKGKELCGPDCIHAYENPWLAVLLNPHHAHYDPFRLWEAEGRVTAREAYAKVGCKRLRVVRELAIPTPTREKIEEFCLRVILARVTELQKKTPNAELAMAKKKLRLLVSGKRAEAMALPWVSGEKIPLNYWLIEVINGAAAKNVYYVLDHIPYRKNLDVSAIAFKVFGPVKPLSKEATK